MARPRNTVPKYLRHKASGQAKVRIAGKDTYLGKYGSPESKKEYRRICAEEEAKASPQERTRKGDPVTLVEVVEAFWEHAYQHYRDSEGRLTSEIKCLKGALKETLELYSHTPATEFGPRALKAMQQHWIKANLARTTINARVNRIRRVFKWAASEQLVPVEAYTALTTVEGLEKNRTKARETDPVEAVLDLHVAATLPYLSPTHALMVLTQRLTGMRPQDVVRMRAKEINRAVTPWVYEPEKHKTSYRGTVRQVRVGASARDLLRPILEGLRPDDVVFSPRREKVRRYAALRAKRKTNVQPSQVSRAKKPSQLERPTPEMYSTATYAAAIRRACDKAGIPRWHPNQLRHAFGMEVRERFGLEAAQVALGHTKANVTQVYAGRDMALAAKVADGMG